MTRMILEESFGNMKAYPATRASAERIYHDVAKNNVPADVRRILNERGEKIPGRLANPDSLLRALKAVLTLPVGESHRSLRFVLFGKGHGDNKDSMEGTVTQDMKDEVAIWIVPKLFLDNVSGNDWESILRHLVLYRKEHPERDMAFLKPFYDRIGDVSWTYPDYFTMADEVHTIECGNWKAGAKEERIAERILDLVNQLTHRDVSYDVIDMEFATNYETSPAP